MTKNQIIINSKHFFFIIQTIRRMYPSLEQHLALVVQLLIRVAHHCNQKVKAQHVHDYHVAHEYNFRKVRVIHLVKLFELLHKDHIKILQ